MLKGNAFIPSVVKGFSLSRGFGKPSIDIDIVILTRPSNTHMGADPPELDLN